MRYGFKQEDLGKLRVVVKFALMPVTLTDGRRVWLEKYKCLQRVCGYSLMGEPSQPPFDWYTVERHPMEWKDEVKP